MAKRVQTITTIVDDFDGNAIDENLVETIEFSVQGSSYRMDLRPENAAKFRKDLEKWIAAAPKITGRRGRPKGSGARASTGSRLSSEELGAIREWARKQGYEVSDRGRIKAEIQDAYNKAHA
ncbi:MAG: Lsr2 family protein [Mycobacterium sp.]|nr:Lsr2 family protein [Mycobacterium sp.]